MPDACRCSWARSKRDAEAFIDCLDYVFLSPGLEAAGAPRLPGRAETGTPGPYPTAAEPSDHLLVTSSW